MSRKTRTNDDIGTTIRNLIEESDYTPSELASKLNVSRSQVSKWMHGTNLKIDTLFMLSQALNCSVDYILYGEEFSSASIAPRPHIDKRLDTFFKVIKNQYSNGISLTDAMNFLIASEIEPDADLNEDNLDSRFALAWATFLSIDTTCIIPKTQRTASIHIDDIKIKHEIDISALETLELCQIMDLLREKKKQYQKRKDFKQLHKENIEREYMANAELAERIKYRANNPKGDVPPTLLPYKDGGRL